MREARIAPARALGQHFLTDQSYIGRIVAAAELGEDDVVIEIGPGLGALTRRLAEAVRHVAAVEIDANLTQRLEAEFRDASAVTIVRGDALMLPAETVLGVAGLPAETHYVLLGNLPYNVGTAIVRHYLEATHPPTRLVVMLQREVAESMTAPEGELSLLGVSVQVYAEARKLFNVPPRAFYPPPQVTSSVVRLDVRAAPLVAPSEREAFFRVVRAGFNAPRKQLRNTLAQGLGLQAGVAAEMIRSAGIDPSLRPQQLSVDDWLRLAGEAASS